MSEPDRRLIAIKQTVTNLSSANFDATLDQLITISAEQASIGNWAQFSEAVDLISTIVTAKEYHYLRTSPAQLLALVKHVSNQDVPLADTVQLLKCLCRFVKRTDGGSEEDCSKTGMDALRASLEAFKRWIKISGDESTELALVRTLLALTNLLKACLIYLKLLPSDYEAILGQLLATLRILSFVGWPDYVLSNQSTDALYASPVNVHSTSVESEPKNSKPSSKGKRRTRSKNRRSGDDEPLLDGKRSEPSESEMSASEFEYSFGADLKMAIREVQLKTRFNSFELMELIVKQVDKRIIFGYWPALLPDSAPSNFQFTIVASVNKDPSHRVRSIAFSLLRALLESGRQFALNLAEASKKELRSTLSFTPLSVTFAGILTELHRAFDRFFFTESSPDVIIQGLKCAQSLVYATPYGKMQSGLLTDLLGNTSKIFQSSRDITTLVCVIGLITQLFESGSTSSELKEHIAAEPGNSLAKRLQQFAIEQIADPKNVQLSGECLKLLTVFLKHHYGSSDLLIESLRLSIEVASNELVFANPVFQSHVSKFLFGVAGVLKEQETIFDNEIEWWQKLIQSELMQTAFDQNDRSLHDSTVPVMLDLLSLLKPTAFEVLSTPPRPLTSFLIVQLLSKCSTNAQPNEQPNRTITSTAIRCLGVYVNFSSTVCDWSFLADVLQASTSLIETAIASEDYKSKDNQLLLNQTTWTAANLCEAINRCRTVHADEDPFEIDQASCQKIGECLLSSSKITPAGPNGDNVRINLTRALSNLTLVLLNEFPLTNEVPQLVSRSVQMLIEILNKSRQAKVHWNCCFALANLNNDQAFQFYIKAEDSALAEKIISDLLKTLKTTKNHKVMSSAAEALASAGYLMSKTAPNETSLGKVIKEIECTFCEKFYAVPEFMKLKWIEKMINSLSRLCMLDNGASYRSNCEAEFSAFVRDNITVEEQAQLSSCFEQFDKLVNELK